MLGGCLITKTLLKYLIFGTVTLKVLGNSCAASAFISFTHRCCLARHRMLNGLSQVSKAPSPNSLNSLRLPHRRLQLPQLSRCPQGGTSVAARRALSGTRAQDAKSTSTVKLKTLGQKPLPAPIPLVADGAKIPKYPTVIQEAYDNIKKYNDCVVLTKVGGFYELYFEQAEELAPLLNLKVAARKTVSGGPVPMVSLP